MTTVKEQLREAGTAVDEQAAPTAGRRELSDLQAQLLALVITIGTCGLFVLIFSWLTGSL
jgi:hypothetical protein